MKDGEGEGLTQQSRMLGELRRRAGAVPKDVTQ
jgi:hypothetical protein